MTYYDIECKYNIYNVTYPFVSSGGRVNVRNTEQYMRYYITRFQQINNKLCLQPCELFPYTQNPAILILEYLSKFVVERETVFVRIFSTFSERPNILKYLYF